jgi:hypothetical protein
VLGSAVEHNVLLGDVLEALVIEQPDAAVPLAGVGCRAVGAKGVPRDCVLAERQM